MIKKWLSSTLLLFPIAISVHGRTGTHTELLALRTFDGGVGVGRCTVKVDSITADDPGVEPREKMQIACADKTPFYWEADYGLSSLTILSDPSRVVATWECGTGMCLTVFALNPTKVRRSVINGEEVDSVEHGGPAARLILDEHSTAGPDIIFFPDVILVYRGKLFPPNTNLIVPKEEDVYAWDNDRYKLQSRYLWNETMHYADRFCVLRNDPTCPARRMKDDEPSVD